MSVGIDLVSVPRIAESLATFGDRFLRRVFTANEIAYATVDPSGARIAPALTAQRLAARFAAKEAAKKALRLDGVGWTELEIVRAADGACELHYRGTRHAMSMSHDGDHATAIVMARGELAT